MSAPDYYKGKDGQPAWNAISNWRLAYEYEAGCVWKYIVRAGKKTEDPRQDYQKAINCLKRMIERYELDKSDAEEKDKQKEDEGTFQRFWSQDHTAETSALRDPDRGSASPDREQGACAKDAGRG